MGSSYRDLRVWQLAMEMVVGVYEQTRDFPKQEIYGLTSQMRRSAVSVPSNIAEGKGRSSDRDRAHFFCHARGSLLELETQVLIAQRLEYLPSSAAGRLLADFGSTRPDAECPDSVSEEFRESKRIRSIGSRAKGKPALEVPEV